MITFENVATIVGYIMMSGLGGVMLTWAVSEISHKVAFWMKIEQMIKQRNEMAMQIKVMAEEEAKLRATIKTLSDPDTDVVVEL